MRPGRFFVRTGACAVFVLVAHLSAVAFDLPTGWAVNLALLLGMVLQALLDALDRHAGRA